MTDIDELTGRELDAAIAERVCGLSLIPPRELAMCRVVWRKVCMTSPQFLLDDGREFSVPEGETLPQPKGSTDWNDRYALYIARQLGDSIGPEVDAYRLSAERYSTDLNACREAELELERRGLGTEYAEQLRDAVAEIHEMMTITNWRKECAMADAETRCRAMLKALEHQKPRVPPQTTSPATAKLVRGIVDALLADMDERAGMTGDLDSSIRREIRREWTRRINEQLRIARARPAGEKMRNTSHFSLDK